MKTHLCSGHLWQVEATLRNYRNFMAGEWRGDSGCDTMKDDTYNSIILLDIIRAMMNEREYFQGTDAWTRWPPGRTPAHGRPFFYAFTIEACWPFTDLPGQRSMKKSGHALRDGVLWFWLNTCQQLSSDINVAIVVFLRAETYQTVISLSLWEKTSLFKLSSFRMIYCVRKLTVTFSVCVATY